METGQGMVGYLGFIYNWPCGLVLNKDFLIPSVGCILAPSL